MNTYTTINPENGTIMHWKKIKTYLWETVQKERIEKHIKYLGGNNRILKINKFKRI